MRPVTGSRPVTVTFCTVVGVQLESVYGQERLENAPPEHVGVGSITVPVGAGRPASVSAAHWATSLKCCPLMVSDPGTDDTVMLGVYWQTPALQEAEPSHAVVQLPQWPGSFCRSTHVPPQLVCPAGHWHVPEAQIIVAGHTVAQSPQ